MDGKQNKSDKDKYCIISLICEIYNKLVNITKKKKQHSDIENKLVTTSGEKEAGRGKIRVGD